MWVEWLREGCNEEKKKDPKRDKQVPVNSKDKKSCFPDKNKSTVIWISKGEKGSIKFLKEIK